jgi:hypothetical protein
MTARLLRMMQRPAWPDLGAIGSRKRDLGAIRSDGAFEQIMGYATY